MKQRDDLASSDTSLADEDLLTPLLQAGRRPSASAVPAEQAQTPLPATVVGRLLALTDEGCTPLVSFDGQPVPGAMPARCTVDLRPAHVGLDVVLVFDGGDRSRPIVTGVLRGKPGWPLEPAPGQVKMDVDGERLTVTATHELVLRCGKSVLTLRSDGRIVLRGEEILTEATGANRIRGGSVQLN
jgi:hypothetical protein